MSSYFIFDHGIYMKYFPHAKKSPQLDKKTNYIRHPNIPHAKNLHKKTNIIKNYIIVLSYIPTNK